MISKEEKFQICPRKYFCKRKSLKFPCLTASMERTLGCPRRMGAVVSSAGLTSFLLRLVEERAPLSTQDSFFSLGCGSYASLETSLSCFLHLSRLALLLQQTKDCLNRNNKKPTYLWSKFISSSYFSIYLICLQPKFIALRTKQKLFSSIKWGPDWSALGFVSCHFPLPGTDKPCCSFKATHYPSEPHPGYRFSQEAASDNQRSG